MKHQPRPRRPTLWFGVGLGVTSAGIIILFGQPGVFFVPSDAANPIVGRRRGFYVNAQSRAARASLNGVASSPEQLPLVRMGASPSVVIVDPDSLDVTKTCGHADERVAQIRSVVRILATTPAVTHLDAGHSAWPSSVKMSVIMNRVGMASARGFATNVANDNFSRSEAAYGEKVSSLTNGSSSVIDTSRSDNGAGSHWCNPAGRKLGVEPSVPAKAGHHDANLWIKPPVESDGFCNGGPQAGTWWNIAAQELLTNSHW